jgi:hypothetical protein
MSKELPFAEMLKIVEILKPLASEDRVRAIKAAMAMLDESHSGIGRPVGSVIVPLGAGDEFANLPPRARSWMRQHGVTVTALQQVFQMTPEGPEVIAHMPGRSKKEQMYNAYILTGLGQLLHTGSASFQDRPARALCEASGCYDNANHSAYLRDKGNEFSGTKDKGWTLTAPGLKRAAEIIAELNSPTA